MKRPHLDLAILGNALRTLRAKADLSQEQLALRSGLARSYVGDVERGVRNATFRSLEKWLTALGGVTWQEFGAAVDREAARRVRR